MIPVLIGAGVLVGGYLVVNHWEEITNWLEDLMPKIQDALTNTRQNFFQAFQMAS